MRRAHYGGAALERVHMLSWVAMDRIYEREVLPDAKLRNRDRGKPHGSAPPTPPDMRVRIRRFRDVSPEGPGVQCRLSP